jgi:hypothetical protein
LRARCRNSLWHNEGQMALVSHHRTDSAKPPRRLKRQAFWGRTGAGMRIVVTGGAGFIGSAPVRHLIGYSDHQVLLTCAGNLASLAPVQRPRSHFSIASTAATRWILNPFRACWAMSAPALCLEIFPTMSAYQAMPSAPVPYSTVNSKSGGGAIFDAKLTTEISVCETKGRRAGRHHYQVEALKKAGKG